MGLWQNSRAREGRLGFEERAKIVFKIQTGSPETFCWLLFACGTAVSQVFKTLALLALGAGLILYCRSLSGVMGV